MGHRSVAFKTFLSIGCLLAVVIVLVTWFGATQQKRLLAKGFDDKLNAVAAGSRNMFHGAAAAYCESEGMRYHRVRPGPSAAGPEGAFETAALAAFQLDPNLASRSAELRNPDGTTIRYVLSPARLREECVRCHGAMGMTALSGRRPGELVAAFGVSMPTTGLQRQVRRTELFCGLAGLALLALVNGLLTRTVRRRVLQPLAAITSAFGRLADGDLAAAAEVQSGDEIGQAAQSFNGMVARLRQTLAALSQSNERLRESEAIFKDFFYNSNVAISMTHVGGTLRANRAYCEIVGYSEEELNHLTWQEITHPDDLAISNEQVNAVLAREKEAANWEKRYFHKDGHIVLVDMHIILRRDEHGEPRYFITTITDLTGRRQAEEEKARLEGQLLHAQKMESVGRLAGGVAHDINNMLAAIMGHMELMKLEHQADARLRYRLGQMGKAAERSRDIVQQLLAFSRKQVVEPVQFNLNDRIEETRSTLAPLLGEDLKLRFQPGAGLWNIRADPSQLDQVLMNLAVNARDAMPGGGHLFIETENRHLDDAYCQEKPEFLPGNFVLLSVSDEGCGMEPEVLGKIFDPFFTTKEEGRGTGLGLSTVFGIVKQNGGFINVYSEPGHGTTFRVYFPADLAAPDERQRAAPAAAGPAGGRILVVEDDAVLQEVIPQMVEQLGYTVRMVRSAEEALATDWQAEGGFDLLLTDVVMPGLSGRELADRCRVLQPNLKVLFMSGYTANIIAQKGVLEAGNHFISKPFTLADLDWKLASLIRG